VPDMQANRSSETRRSRWRPWAVRIALGAAALAAAGAALLVYALRWAPGRDPVPIGQGWGASRVPRFVGRPAVPQPLPVSPVPQHPFMAANGSNNMHADSYVTDTHRTRGPLGERPEVRSTARGLLGGECASVTFDRRGRLVTVCMSKRAAELLLLDPRTLAELARYDLPQRPSNRGWSLRRILTDTSGGAYFYLDHHDRAVLATSAHRIEVVGIVDRGNAPAFRLERSYDLRDTIVRAAAPQDAIVTVLPDWEGRYWFVTRHGLVGTVDPAGGAVRTLALAGEEIQNSFAVGRDAVYVVSDHALYRFEADPGTGAPHVVWREAYDRGTRRKIGMINQGSGTTPTLLGEEHVAIADNAEPRVNVLVYRRAPAPAGGRLVCSLPVFAPGRSATDNTFIGVGRSLVVENNAGYDIFPTMTFGRTGAGGVVRIDLDAGGGGCHVVWESAEISQTTVPKLSLGSGLVYLYTKAADAPRGVDAYYLTAVDFRTGATVFRILTGTGLGYDNNWAPITIGPDGTAYVGVLRGLVAVRDGAS
jgi:hypothetical protein